MSKLKFTFLAVLLISCSAHDAVQPIITGTGNSQHKVSLQDVSILANAISRGALASTKAEADVMPTITPIVDIFTDTLFFAVDFNPGWKLISSDRRTPVILAESDSGSFRESMTADGPAEWLEFMAEDLRRVKRNPEWTYPEVDCEGASFQDIWEAVSPYRTKSFDGRYELYETYYYPVAPTIVDHLTYPVRWNQWSNYNKYCPYKSDGSGERVPAGCVAVAGAQMLYYLHTKIGRPASSPSSGYCIGQVGNYSQHFSNFTQAAIDSALYNNDYAALLIGFVGMSVGMNYGNSESGATTSDLVDVFESFGIECEYSSYNESRLRSSLLDSIPVIVRADGKKTTFLGIPSYSYGHSFIIDGFRSERKKIVNKYVWCNYVENPDSLDTYMPVPDFSNYYYDTTYTSPTIYQIKMNWGFISSASYNTWYTPTGNWHTTETDPECDFDYRRKMIYNFHCL